MILIHARFGDVTTQQAKKRSPAKASTTEKGQSANSNVGPLVRRLRQEAEMTLEQLASASGVSRAMLSSVERGDKNPTLPILANIAAGLGVGMSELMGEQPASFAAASVTTLRSRLVYRDERTGIERQLLSPTHLDMGMEVVEHVLPAGQVFDGIPHAGMRTTKCVVVNEGQLTLEIGNVVYTLEAGDAVTFEVQGAYRFRNKQADLCRYYLFMLHQRIAPPGQQG
jgi:transcriptional regulator with XRE-family HTH domain